MMPNGKVASDHLLNGLPYFRLGNGQLVLQHPLDLFADPLLQRFPPTIRLKLGLCNEIARQQFQTNPGSS